MRLALRKTELETQAFAAAAESGRTEFDIDLQGGSIVVRDSRVFQPARRDFCLRLLEAAVRQPDVLTARIDLAANTCRLDFGAKSRSTRELAAAFAAAVGQALEPLEHRGEPAWRGSTGDTSTLTAYPAERGASVWETAATGTERVRLRHHTLANSYVRRARLAATAQNLAGVRRCDAGVWTPVLTIDLEPNSRPIDQIIGDLERLRTSLGNAAADGAGTPAAPPVMISGGRRALNAVLGGGFLGLTGVALMIPGMPTMPFLFAASYYLARSSPQFDGMLHRTAIIGPVLTEWEMYYGLSARSKRRLIGLTTVILLATVVLFPVPVIGTTLMLAVFALSVHSVVRIPGLPPPGLEDRHLPVPTRAALVGPAR